MADDQRLANAAASASTIAGEIAELLNKHEQSAEVNVCALVASAYGIVLIEGKAIDPECRRTNAKLLRAAADLLEHGVH